MKAWQVLNKTCSCQNGTFKTKSIEIKVSSRSKHKPVTFTQNILACTSCNLPKIDKKTQEALEIQAKAVAAKQQGLLTGDEIFLLRKNLNMTRDQFGEYLHVLPLSIYMWEKRGRIQNKSTDALIRLKCDPKYLSEHREEINKIFLRKREVLRYNSALKGRSPA